MRETKAVEVAQTRVYVRARRSIMHCSTGGSQVRISRDIDPRLLPPPSAVAPVEDSRGIKPGMAQAGSGCPVPQIAIPGKLGM